MAIRTLIFLLGVIVLPFSAAGSQLFAVTPSGTPEAVFAGKAPAAASRLSSKCMDVQWTVVSSSDTEVVCESPLSTGQSIMGQMLLGNSYSTPPRRFFRFNVSELSGLSRVQVSGWMETQMAFGQMQRAPFSGADFHNSVMSFLISAGGSFPAGTTFPNHAVLGVLGRVVPGGRNAIYEVAEVTPGAAADRAGLKAGDTITSVAGKKFKTDSDFLDCLAKATKAPTYPLDVTRNGSALAVTVERDYRPAATQVASVAEDSTTVTTPVAQAVSVADELTKLLKLKEQGILTQTEFDSQKSKLLNQ
ncbi:PDZ domain-containing protein [Xanthomonas arboricola pv. corylina]|uniref:PDZ domain-containing protein n=1 Tax=Xanthomonas arboricola TaxID=56448 RepID=UPI0040408A08